MTDMINATVSEYLMDAIDINGELVKCKLVMKIGRVGAARMCDFMLYDSKKRIHIARISNPSHYNFDHNTFELKKIHYELGGDERDEEGEKFSVPDCVKINDIEEFALYETDSIDDFKRQKEELSEKIEQLNEKITLAMSHFIDLELMTR